MERYRKDLIRITKINKNGDIGIIPISPSKKYLRKPEKWEYRLNNNFYCLYLRGYQERFKALARKFLIERLSLVSQIDQIGVLTLQILKEAHDFAFHAE